MELKVYETKAGTVEALAEDLYRMIVGKKGTVTMALSGGSTPADLFSLLAGKYGEKIPWNRVKLFWVDERCVPSDHRESNYAMTRQTLIDRISIGEENVFPVIGDAEPQEEAKRYGDLLDREVEKENGKPVFDIILLGMGEDGHTASIFPDQIELFDAPENCVTAVHPDSGQKRISITGSVINKGRNVFFLVCGSGKKDVLEQVLRGDRRYPASLVKPLKGSLSFYLDRAASPSS